MANVTKKNEKITDDGKTVYTYLIRVSNGFDSEGKRIRQSKSWSSPPVTSENRAYKLACSEATRFEDAVISGIKKDGKIRFKEFSELWLEKHARQNLKIKTVAEYEKRLELINKYLGHYKLEELKRSHLNDFYNALSKTRIRSDNAFSLKIDLAAKLKEQKLSREKLAKLAGVSASTVKSAISGNRISKKSAVAMSKALDMKLADAFNEDKSTQLLSPETVRTYHRIISSILGYAVEEDHIAFNPAAKAKLPKKINKEASHLDEADARRLLELLHREPIKYRAMIAFDLLSGLRRSELLGLRWQDVDYDNETIRIIQSSQYVKGHGIYVDTPKNETSSRVIKLSTSAFVLLREYEAWQEKQREICGDYWKDKDNRVFTGDDGAPVHPDTLSKRFKDIVKRFGLPDDAHLHSLRHSFASLMIADGVPLVVVSKRLGHKQVSTTANIYAHVIQSADEKAAQVGSKFDDVLLNQDEKRQRKYLRT